MNRIFADLFVSCLLFLWVAGSRWGWGLFPQDPAVEGEAKNACDSLGVCCNFSCHSRTCFACMLLSAYFCTYCNCTWEWHDSFCVHGLWEKVMSFPCFPDSYTDCLLLAWRRQYLHICLKFTRRYFFLFVFLLWVPSLLKQTKPANYIQLKQFPWESQRSWALAETQVSSKLSEKVSVYALFDSCVIVEP